MTCPRCNGTLLLDGWAPGDLTCINCAYTIPRVPPIDMAVAQREAERDRRRRRIWSRR